MKQYFYKAKSMIIIFTATAMLFTLGGMAFLKNRENQKLLSWMSDHYAMVSLSQNEEETPILDKNNLLKQLSIQKKEFLLMKQYAMTDVYGVYDTSGRLFHLNIQEGHAFTKKDFHKKSNTAVISSLVKKDCANRNGILWWKHQQKWYQVIGIYDGTNQGRDSINTCYVNLNSRNLDGDIVDGTYVYDIESHTEKYLQKASESIMKNFPGVVLEHSMYGDNKSLQYANKGDNFNGMFLLLLATALLVLMNSFSVCYNWMKARQKEIGVRRMVGAEKSNIYFWIFKSFFVILGCSFLIGVGTVKIFLMISAHLPVEESVRMMFGNKISFVSILIGFVTVSVLGIIILLITLSQYHKREIVGNLK